MAGKKRSRKQSRFGLLVEIVDERALEDGGTLRLYKCVNLHRQEDGAPDQLEYRKNGKNTYLVKNPIQYDLDRIQRLFFSINSLEEFKIQSAQLNSEYVPEVKVEEIDENTRDLKMQQIIDSESGEERFDPEGPMSEYERGNTDVGQENEEEGLGAALEYAEAMCSMG